MNKQPGPRMTLPTQLVLREMLAEPTQEMYGLQICEAAGLPSGTIHPILARFEALGWLESRWEDASPQEEGRPRRRYYRLTQDGAERARIALAQATTSVSTIGLRADLGRELDLADALARARAHASDLEVALTYARDQAASYFDLDPALDFARDLIAILGHSP